VQVLTGTGSTAAEAVPDPGAVIALYEAARAFGPLRALKPLTLTVRPGERIALLGPNGAGKTTAISVMLGLLAPDTGSVRLFGQDPAAAIAAGRVGAMLQDGGLMRGVRVRELLAMLAAQYSAPISVERVCALAQLGGLEDRLVQQLSGGQSQRVRVAIALIGNPELLILDEPTAAMDVEARRTFWAAMAEQSAAGRTILFSTHYLEEADEIADRVILLAAGRLVADGTPEEIKASVGLRAVRFAADAPIDGLEHLPGVTSVAIRAKRVELYSTDTDATLRGLIAGHPGAREIEVGGIGLEEAFLALTDAADAA
jgi:ABC-2 type transport system ATP-binding protein